MRETLIKLDDINSELKSALESKNGKACIDEKWLFVFDTILKDMINTRSVIEFAVGKDGRTDWEFVSSAVKKS